ncbi:MAG: isochorismatase family protein [Myxococcota bacterium]
MGMDLRLLRSDTAVLVVDVQERLLAAMAPDAAQSVVRRSADLVETARLLGLPVHHTEQYPQGLGPTAATVKSALTAAKAPPALSKTCFSALGAPEVLRWLNGVRARRVVVTGMEAHVCVYQTVRDLCLEGFLTHVPHDAICSRRAADHAAALEMIRAAGAQVTTTESVIFELLGSSEDPAFKELSRRLK